MEEKKVKKRSIIKNKKIILLALLIFGTVIFMIAYLLPGYYYFNKWCQKTSRSSSIEVYVCERSPFYSQQAVDKIFEKIKLFCVIKGLKTKGLHDLFCFNVKDEGNKCDTGDDCSSGYCVMYSNDCKENCVGSCWGDLSEPGCEKTRADNKYKILQNGKAIPYLCH